MHVGALRWIVRRWWFVVTLRLKAVVKRAELDLRIAPDVRLGRRVRVSLDARSRNVLHVGPRCELHDDVLLLLRGGSVTMGPRVQIRRGSVLNVSGELVFEGRNILSYYNTVHCLERIVLRDRATASEFVVIADSRHFPDGPAEWFVDNVESAPIDIGPNTWLAAKVTVTQGVRTGADCIVAANSVARGDVPDGAVVAGVPGRIVRRR